MSLEAKLGKLKLKNPVILASGTFDKTIVNNLDINLLGAVTTKTITLEPRTGNPLPHIIKTKYGWLNSVGLKNPGIEKYLTEELPFWQKFDTEIITSIGGDTLDDYVTLAKKLNGQINTLEINISCPNIEKGGLSFGTDPKLIVKLVSKVRKVFSGNLIVKLTPNITNIKTASSAALEGGSDILNIANTYLGMEIDNKKKVAKLFRKTGGYCGPAIKPLALKNIYEVYKAYKCPIIGSGGITEFSDVLDFIMCGATAVSIGSSLYTDRTLPIKILNDFNHYIEKENISNLRKIKGVIK